jgi:hypothetical protein
LPYAASLEINHAHDHGAVRVEGQTLEPASAIERAHKIVERVCDNAEAADVSGGSERRRNKRFTRRYRDKAANDALQRDVAGRDIVLWRTVAPLLRFAISQNRCVSD